MDAVGTTVVHENQHADSNSKEQFANSPDPDEAVMHAVVDSLEVHKLMCTQALRARSREGRTPGL